MVNAYSVERRGQISQYREGIPDNDIKITVRFNRCHMYFQDMFLHTIGRVSINREVTTLFYGIVDMITSHGECHVPFESEISVFIQISYLYSK